MLREQTLPKQKALGVVPQDAELTARHAEIPGWDDMPAELKPVLARQMEIYAGFLEQTDHHGGRLVDAIDDLGALDNTLVYYILGDNGASAEGTPNGCSNEMCTLNGLAGVETPEFLLSKIDDFGTPEAYNDYAVGWAHALCGPYQWTKQVASHWGGTRNQFHHVIDVVPTILEAAGLPAPMVVNSIIQAPLEGVSMLATLSDENAAETHELQYFEMFGNRGIYHNGWTAVTKHRTPWLSDSRRSTTTSGNSTDPTTGPRPTIWRPTIRRNSPSCNGSGSSRRPNTTCYRSTTGPSSASTPTSPGGLS